MAVVNSRARAEIARLQWREQQGSPERTKVWTEPRPRPVVAAFDRKVAVVYYLSRNGHLEQPHFMEVTLSSPDGLYLRDVISRLNALRGKGMALMYSWSSKRSYKNGYVWHDLADDDYIHPVHGHDYVLKGTELRLLPYHNTTTIASSSSQETTHVSSSSSENTRLAQDNTRKKWNSNSNNSLELSEYRVVYKNEENTISAADASTQTDEQQHRRNNHRRREQLELEREEISPPPLSSSPDTLETLVTAHGRVVVAETGNESMLHNSGVTGPRTKASSVLMQLISCGPFSAKCGASSSLPLVPTQYRLRLPRPVVNDKVRVEVTDGVGEMPRFRGKIVEEKEYFSGSLVEGKMSGTEIVGDCSALRRSSSCNGDRATKMELSKDIEDIHARCMPRKPKNIKEGYLQISRGTHASKRFSNR